MGRKCAFLVAIWVIGSACAGPLPAAGLLPGEFAGIDLGRPLVYPRQFPTIEEFRQIARKSEMSTVLMIRLFASQDNHYLPIFSEDGRRLAFQRSDLRAKSSQILLYPSLDQAEPTLLSDQPAAYDYMFRWAINSESSYAFVRIDAGKMATQIYLSTDGGKPERKALGEGRYLYPAVYSRTDGIRRLVYEQDGKVMHQAWNQSGPVDAPLALAQGTSPRWSCDGYRLLLARERSRHAGAIGYEVVVRNLRSETDLVLSGSQMEIGRGLSWSRDEQFVAFYVREASSQPWRIRICPVKEGVPARTLGNDVVVDLNFDSEGPAWEPGSRRVWFFSQENRQQAYYPLSAADVETGAVTVVDYPRKITTPMDLAVNPAGAAPEMAFVAHADAPQDLFLIFLNHF